MCKSGLKAAYRFLGVARLSGRERERGDGDPACLTARQRSFGITSLCQTNTS